MRTINGRFLLVSAGLMAILGVGAELLHQIQVRRSSGILLEQGTRKIDEGQIGQAIGYLTRYTKLEPQNVNAQILLANTLADVGRTDAAIKWYEQALRRDASRHEARRRLVELAIAAQRFPVAKAHLVDFLLQYTSDDPRVYYLLGVCHERLGEYGDAIQRLREAISRDPALVEAYSLLATVLRDQRRAVDEADALMDRLVVANASGAEARLARADYRSKYHLAGVAVDVRAAVELAPDDYHVLFRAGQTILALATASSDQAALSEESESYLRTGQALQPRFAGWYLGLAQVYRIRGELSRAVALLEEGLAAVPNDGDLQWNLASLVIQQGRIDEGLGIVARLRDQGYPRVPLEYLVAVVDARRNRFVEASERLSAIRGQMQQWPELAGQTEFWLGTCYGRMGEYGLQLTALRHAVALSPSWVPARQSLASALVQTGRLDEATAEYESLARQTNAPVTVYRDLSRLLVLRELQRRVEQRQWSRVTAFLDRAEAVDSATDHYAILRAEILLAQRDADAARGVLRRVISDHPDSVAARLALASLEQSADHWELADRMIDAVQRQFGDSIEVRVARLRYLVQRYGVDSYEGLQALERSEFHADSQSEQRWRTSLAATYYSLGRRKDAARLWERASEAQLDDIRYRLFLFDVAMADGDDARMRELTEEIGRIERSQQRPLWRYGKATCLVLAARNGDTSVLPEAAQLLEEVQVARPTWSRVPLLRAEIDELRSDLDTAAEDYLAAIELGERSPAVIRRVVELLYRQRRYTEADGALRKFEAMQLPMSSELSRLAADAAFRAEDFDRAMQIAVQVIGQSDAYEDLVWMAQLYSVMGRREQAEVKFREAIDKKPSSPDAWVALVQHFLRNDHRDLARKAVDALAQHVDPDSAVFVEAMCLRVIRDYDRAAAKFARAAQAPDAEPIVLRAAADFFLSRGMPARGQPLIDRLLAHPDASPADRRWARRNLAIIWATADDPAKKSAALALVNRNLEDDPSSIADLRAKAVCLEALGGPAHCEAALAIVEELIRENQSASTDCLTAYRICLALGRQAGARRYLQQHTFANSTDPQSVARYVRFVLGHDELHEAEVWIERLEQLCLDGISAAGDDEPATRRRYHKFYVLATGLGAQLSLRRNEPQAAIQKIVQRVGSRGDPATEVAPAEAAQLLVLLSRPSAATDETSAAQLRSAAESLLRAGADASPSEAATLVLFLAQEGRVAEAASVWQTHFDASVADEFAVLAAALAAHPELGARDLDALARRVQGLPSQRRSKTVLTALAQLLAFQSRHADAIAAQREILAKDPEDVSAINNLACYLALSGNDATEALELINAATSKVGPNATLLDSRGVILLELGRAQEATHAFEQSLERAPNPVTYLHLAAARKQLDQNDQYEDAITRARRAGLDVSMLHPLERARFRDLLK